VWGDITQGGVDQKWEKMGQVGWGRGIIITEDCEAKEGGAVDLETARLFEGVSLIWGNAS